MRLFCLPPAGGGASGYRSWAGAMPGFVDVCPLHPPGREDRFQEQPFRRMESLVPDLAEAILPLCRPRFALFGHSLGALVAFELARHLRRDPLGPQPAHLFVAAAAPPRLVASRRPARELHEHELVAMLARLNGTSPAVLAEPELLALVLPPLRADVELYSAYRYVEEPPLECPISAFEGSEDDLEMSGWSDETTAGFRHRTVQGGHFFVQRAPRELLEALADDLALPAVAPGGARRV
jgi:surfactin synthase thioesterase subunit